MQGKQDRPGFSFNETLLGASSPFRRNAEYASPPEHFKRRSEGLHVRLFLSDIQSAREGEKTPETEEDMASPFLSHIIAPIHQREGYHHDSRIHDINMIDDYDVRAISGDVIEPEHLDTDKQSNAYAV